MSENKINDGVYPVLPMRDMIVFPGVVVPLFIGRDKSIAALENALQTHKQILLVAQTDAEMDTPYSGDLYKVGTFANILQTLKLPDGTIKILAEGVTRAKVLDWTQSEPFFEAHAETFPDKESDTAKIEVLTRSVTEQFEMYVQLSNYIGPEALIAISNIKEANRLTNVIAAHLVIKIEEKQKLLEAPNLAKRMEDLFALMEKELDVMQVERKIRKRVKKQMEKSQREYYLNEQIFHTFGQVWGF